MLRRQWSVTPTIQKLHYIGIRKSSWYFFSTTQGDSTTRTQRRYPITDEDGEVVCSVSSLNHCLPL